MTEILERDRTGKCEGECEDRVRAGEEERQAKISDASVDSPESYPNVPWANSRNEQPGVFGGHV
jgi:hypothetical protein